MADVRDGFGVTIGVILAVIFTFIVGGMLLCGGCFAFVGVGTGVIGEAAKQAEKTRERNREKEAAANKQPEVVPADQEEKSDIQAEEMPEEEAKDEPALKAETATENAPQEKTAEPSKTAPDREGAAAGRLVMAKSIARKNLTAARKRYQEIIDKYPGTEAATEAATLLEK